MTSSELWREFSHDPRDPAYAGMRASDADRDVVQRALGEAYAEGRLTADELDERTSAVAAARTLGELPAFLGDLVPATAPAVVPTGLLTPAQIDAEAVERYRKSRREAMQMWLTVSTICWVIYLVTNAGGHPWPVYPMLGTAFPMLATLVQRADMIEQNRKRIVAKQEKAIAKAEKQRRELGPGTES